MLTIYIDADACPVKAEATKVAERHGIEMFIVSNGGMRPSQNPKIHTIVVDAGADEADDWIAERAEKGDVVVTADILLAQRCLEGGAGVVNPNGKLFTSDTIGNAVAGRALSAHLREIGHATHNPSFSKQDRSRFLQSIEQMIQDAKRL